MLLHIKNPAKARSLDGTVSVKTVKKSVALKLTNQRLDGCLGITEIHSRVGIKEKSVLDTCKTGVHGTFEHNDRLGPMRFYDRHAIDRT